jgi:hypothetical protein
MCYISRICVASASIQAQVISQAPPPAMHAITAPAGASLVHNQSHQSASPRALCAQQLLRLTTGCVWLLLQGGQPGAGSGGCAARGLIYPNRCRYTAPFASGLQGSTMRCQWPTTCTGCADSKSRSIGLAALAATPVTGGCAYMQAIAAG